MTLSRPFNDALEDLRISGSVLLAERYAAPWAIDIPDEATLRAALGLGAAVRVVPFHLVRAGAFSLAYENSAPQRVEVDEVAICPSGAPHRMFEGQRAKAVSLADVLAKRLLCAPADDAGATELICGVFLLRSAPLNPLLAALPRVLKVKTSGATSDPLLRHAVSMLGLEVSRSAASFVASRLLEVFFAEAIRAYGLREGVEASGWFRGLDDPKVGLALTRLHDAPGRPWTVEALAETCALSPSRFAARFREVTGQSAMSYVANWRMTVACQRLRDTNDNLDNIANSVGYRDVASFSRAFKALVGQSPARWRTSPVE